MPTPQARIRNIALRQGAQVIKRHDGEPQPEPPDDTDPNLRSWPAHLIGGKRLRFLGYVAAATESAAIQQAAFLFSIDSGRRKRLSVNPRR